MRRECKMELLKVGKSKTTKVDPETFQWAHHWSWRERHGYVIHRMVQDGKYFNVILHRLIMGVPSKPYMVDHIDGDTLNNLKSNLRVVTNRSNSTNRRIHRNGQLPGVTLRKDCNRWQAQITINNKHLYLGMFKTMQEANSAYSERIRAIAVEK